MRRIKKYMRVKWIVWLPVLAALVLSGILVPAARAGSFHFNKPLAFSLGSMVMNGDLVGLGNEKATVTLTGFGTVRAMCQNKGGQQAPGRNLIQISVQQTEVYRTDENGHAAVEVIAKDPTLSQIQPKPSNKQAGCPNGNWKVVGIVNGSTDWTAAEVVVQDGAGQIQVNLSFKCTTFFTNGVSTGIKCQES